MKHKRFGDLRQNHMRAEKLLNETFARSRIMMSINVVGLTLCLLSYNSAFSYEKKDEREDLLITTKFIDALEECLPKHHAAAPDRDIFLLLCVTNKP